MAPELVTLDCGLTHVLQVPNTQPYHGHLPLTRQDWGYMWGRHTQRHCPKWQNPLAKYISVDPGKNYTFL